MARELLGEQALGRESPPSETFELPDLAGLEAVGIAEDGDGA
jgi:hypothetical protein